MNKVTKNMLKLACALFVIGLMLPGCATRKVYEIGHYKNVMEPKVISWGKTNEHLLVYCEDQNRYEESIWIYQVDKRMYDIVLRDGKPDHATLAQDGYTYWKLRKRLDSGEIKSMPLVDGQEFLPVVVINVSVLDYVDRHRWYYYIALPLYVPAAIFDAVTFPCQYIWGIGTGLRIGP